MLSAIVFGLGFAAVLVWVGILISRGRHYELISGYNRAPAEERARYDIEGLADHLGNGLITLGIILMFAVLFFYLELFGWLVAAIGTFVFIAAIIVIGGQKFTPLGEQPHAFFNRILPAATYRWMEETTREWLIECSKCRHKRDYWEAGGIRHGTGNPRMLNHCERCQRWGFHKVRKKSAAERKLLS